MKSYSHFIPRHASLLAIFLTLLLPSLTRAATLNVPTTTYPTIQAAVNAAGNGDTVLVAAGTYSGAGNRDIDVGGKSLTVTSQVGAGNTIIDCGGYNSTDGSGNHRGFYLHSGEKNATISGFTIKNGHETYVSSIPDSGLGGGVFNENSTNGGAIMLTNCIITANAANSGGGVFNASGGMITLANCNVSGNTAQNGSGGGIENFNSYSGAITLTNCNVSGNTAQFGGGIRNDNYYGDSGMITLTNCTVSGNTAEGSGGIDNDNSGMITLANCTISANTARYGGGGIENFNSYSGTVTLTNCNVSGNTAQIGGGGINNETGEGGINNETVTLTNCTITANVGQYGGVYSDNEGGAITLTNDIIYGDTGSEEVFTYSGTPPATVSYCDVQGGSPGTGNIDADPLFINAATGDLHLQSGSPCLGKGTASSAPATDKDGRTRPSPPSMGAYELAATLQFPAQYPTIQSAVTAALSGDTVVVAAGTYTGPGNVDWDFGGKDITVKSADGAANTIIDCGGTPSTDGSGNHRGFYIHSGETNAVVEGITVENGYETYVPGVADSGYGGSICVDGSSAAVKNCVFTGSTATIAGGGIAAIGKGHHSITFTNCVFTKNNAPNGGGVYSGNDGSMISLSNSSVSGNTAQNGGGIYNQNSGGSTGLTGCSVADNTAKHGGGGVYNENDMDGDTITLINCSISGNASPVGGGVYDFNSNSDDTILLINDIVYGDPGSEVSDNPLTASATSITFSDIQGGTPGTGNIDIYPLYVDAAAGDLHLKIGSPCTGKGTPDGAPTTDKDGNTRPNPPSMGAYEPTEVPVKTAGITRVAMISSHELDVDVATVSTVPLTRFVALDMTINGQPVHVSEKVFFGNPLDNPHSFIIDLKKVGVPRFRDNQRFTITESYQDNGNSSVEDKANGIILLPVVIIPGIGPVSGTIIGDLLNDDHAGGGQGTFQGFEDYLHKTSQSLVDSVGLGDGYENGIVPTNYQTLYTLGYVRNIASFSDGAQALANQIGYTVSQTYANRVNIITHSKGGLVTRQYLANLGDNASNTVKGVILTSPPNLGSPLAVAGKVINHEYDYRNLTPVYPWFRPVQRLSSYFKLPPNPELDSLNRQRLPSGINYALG